MKAMRNQAEPLKASQYIQTAERLLYVVQELSAARDLETVMGTMRHSACDLTDSDGIAFVLRDHDLYYYTEEGSTSPLWKGNRFPMQICISRWVMLSRSPAIIEDIYSDPRIPIDVYQKTYVKNLAMVPTKTNDPVGAIGCYWTKKHNAMSEQIKVLQALTDIAAIAMDNIHYQSITVTKAKQLEDVADGTSPVIANMVEQKDLYIAGYQKRTVLVGLAVAEELGWSRGCYEKVLRAGTVHGIGKIRIPSELLVKPAKLIEIEYALIKTHSEVGYTTLKNVPLLSEIVQIILQHHERYNGSEYPHGLKQDEILPEAQILAVAGVSEPMIPHRPYRPALGIDTAIDELIQNRGIFYHPDIVDAIVHLVKDKEHQIPE